MLFRNSDVLSLSGTRTTSSNIPFLNFFEVEFELEHLERLLNSLCYPTRGIAMLESPANFRSQICSALLLKYYLKGHFSARLNGHRLAAVLNIVYVLRAWLD